MVLALSLWMLKRVAVPPMRASEYMLLIAVSRVPGKTHESESLDQRKSMSFARAMAREKMKVVNMISFLEWCGCVIQTGRTLVKPVL